MNSATLPLRVLPVASFPAASRVWFALLLAGAAVFSASPAFATSPVLSRVTPRGLQRGTEAKVLFIGDRLEDAKEIVFYEPGLEVVEFTVVDPKQVKAKIKVAADCVPGTKHVRVRTQTGLTLMQNFRVGTLPNLAEVEPNNDFASPQVVNQNVTIEGVITNEDQDYFVVEAKKGDRLSAEVEGIRLADFLFDPYLAVLNEQRFELASSDDAAFAWQDGVVSLLVPEDGKYIIQLRESSYGGNGNCHYRLHIGNFPRPVATLPSGGKPGETLKVTYLGDAKGELTQDVTLPTTWADREFSVFAQDDLGISPTGNLFRISPLDNFVETENNETRETATPMTVPGAANGVIRSATDLDFFKFTATKGQVFDVKVYARQLRSELDPVLYIQNAGGGNVVANDDANGSPDSALRFTAPADGEFFLHIKDHLNRGGNSFHYRVEVSPVAPSLQVTVNEFVQFNEHRLVVAQGNRVPLLVTATRRDFGGPLSFFGEGLPEGVTIESRGMMADQNTEQIILVASPEAPPAVKLSKLMAKLEDANNPFPPTAEIRQDVTLVRGQNNRPFWTEQIPSIAVGVIEKVPFTLQIVEPKVPLVQSGQMQLKVIATREGDFKAPIKIELVQNPPGVNSSREVSIPEGQNEALILINSAGNAKVGEFPICVRGEAPVGNGSVMVATPFATLKVSEPYLKLNYGSVAAVELGAETVLPVQVEVAKPFPGDAQVTLVGLPNKITTEGKTMNAELKELVFPIKAEADASPGLTKNLYCQIIITENGEPILHNIGSGQLRVDKPLPPKTNEPAPAAAATPAPKPAAPAAKPLSRLEQLRLEQKQRLEAQNAGAGNQ